MNTSNKSKIEDNCIIYSLDEIDTIAQKIIEEAKHKTILFRGEMGVGKTTLIKSIGKFLGANKKMTSPTFSVVNEYEISDGILYHFDFYRIKNLEEALDFGVEEYLGSGHWNLIEWPDKIFDELGNKFVEIEIVSLESGLRKICLY